MQTATYSIFELVRVLSVNNERDILHSKVFINKCGWHETEDTSILALSCSNAFILLRYSSISQQPLVRQIPWSHDPIRCLTFDPSGSWLLVLSHRLFIIPALSCMNPGLKINRSWSTDDVTILDILPKHHDATTVVWWHSFDDMDVAVVGSKKGWVYFVDMVILTVITKCWIDGHVTLLDILFDDMSRQLLVTMKDGSQQKVLLETRNSPAQRLDDDIVKLGYQDVTLVTSILNVIDETRSMFLPVSLQQFTHSMIMSSQSAKGYNYVAVHDHKASTFRVYNGKTDNIPYHTYKLPVGSTNVIYSDKVMFTVSIVQGRKLCVISSKNSETTLSDEVNNTDALLQQFHLPSDEKILSIRKKTFPSVWHERREEAWHHQSHDHNLDVSLDTVSNMSIGSCVYEGVFGVPLGDQTVLEGCVLVTDKSVYQLQPRISPERLFLQLTLEYNSTKLADSLATALSLDTSSLFELSAEQKLTAGDYGQAVKLYQLSKCSPLKRVAAFACYGRIPEILSYIKQSLTVASVTQDDKHQLADLAVTCYVHQICSAGGDSSCNVYTQFSDFLLTNVHFNRTACLKLLVKKRLFDLLFLVAKTQGLVFEALEILTSRGEVNPPMKCVEMLVERGYFIHLLKAGEGIFIRCMSPRHSAQMLCSKPKIAVAQYAHIESILSSLNYDELLKIAIIFDPCKPLVRRILADCFKTKTRCQSYGSLASFTSEVIDATKSNTFDYATNLLELFVKVLLAMNKIHTMETPPDLSLLLPHQNSTENIDSIPSIVNHMTPQAAPIGCGFRHCVVARNKDVYCWGKQHGGRLGVGQTTPNGRVLTPTRIDPLHVLQISVTVVSCGREHTLALTQHGVFAWGSSQYGQLGVGVTDRCLTRPMVIEALAGVECVSVSCGQYHSLFLSDRQIAYSCGWGVHGQLGHGNPNDQSIPTKIKMAAGVTRIAAGYCHSVLLTTGGDVYTFGCGLFGQLGHGSNSKSSTPVRVASLPDKITNIATGYFHTLVVTSNNRIFTWGSHPHNLRQLAHSRKQERRFRAIQKPRRAINQPVNYLSPSQVDTSYVNRKIAQISCGAYHNALLTSEGEVFTWGRSTDGQLGSPRKSDHRMPTMITSVNDRQMTYIQCGMDFTVSMDTDGLVWVWGKNDCGQLGLPIPDPVHKSKRGTSHDGVQPVVLHGLPSMYQVLKSSPDSRFLSMSENLLPDVPLENHNSSAEEMNLESCSPLPYHVNAMQPLLLRWGEMCNVTRIAQLCVNAADWLAAAHVYSYQINYPMALMCHLRVITTTTEHPSHTGHISDVFASDVLNHYLGLLSAPESLSPESVILYRRMLSQVIDFWLTHSLEWTKLEEILTNHVEKVACILALMFFTQNGDDSAINRFDVIFKLTNETRLKFTTKFILRVLQENLKIIPENEQTRELLEKTFAPLNHTKNGLELESLNRLVPYDRLCHEIEQNLRKDWNTNHYVTVSIREVASLKLQINSQPLSISSGFNFNEKDREAVVFTCGHNFTWASLRKDVSRLFNNLDLAKVGQLESIYNQSEVIALPCPKCLVVNTTVM